ncbi:hypothetical protein, partial [Nocardia sp. NPDC051570]|uniref:hypothetical protein n=1 Tax=Nocardia sp. NPDC051570 TaxID=3364324 RepID=UPI00379F147C
NDRRLRGGIATSFQQDLRSCQISVHYPGETSDAVSHLENDPRLLAQREQMIDALNQPPARQPASAPSPSWPQQVAAPAPRREPTPKEEEETDPYYQRKSWLEY